MSSITLCSSWAARSSTFPSCPGDNGKTHTIGSYTYSVSCSKNANAGDNLAIYSDVASLQHGANFCEQYNLQHTTGAQCIAGVKESGANTNPGQSTTCWLKPSFGPNGASNYDSFSDTVIQIKPPISTSSVSNSRNSTSTSASSSLTG